MASSSYWRGEVSKYEKQIEEISKKIEQLKQDIVSWRGVKGQLSSIALTTSNIGKKLKDIGESVKLAYMINGKPVGVALDAVEYGEKTSANSGLIEGINGDIDSEISYLQLLLDACRADKRIANENLMSAQASLAKAIRAEEEEEERRLAAERAKKAAAAGGSSGK